MAAANGDLPDDRRILLRIGINLGDVIVEGGDLNGDGVNIAARLDAIAVRRVEGGAAPAATFSRLPDATNATFVRASREVMNCEAWGCDESTLIHIASGDTVTASPICR
jgi:class 3 adenylate cyclase